MQFIKIDKEFQNLLRPLTAEEFKSLEDSIKQDGCLRPIELWNGYIADGHNRYSICMKNGIHFEQVDVTDKFETKSDVMKWIVQNQRARQTGRQLSKTELVEMALAVEKQVAIEAKAAHDANGGDKKSEEYKKSATSNLNHPIGRKDREPTSAAKAAEAIGVSENTYRDMKLVTEKGSDEQIERMNKGGRGNAPSAIAKEIKGTKVKETFKCRECGKLFPITEAHKRESGKTDNLCKSCHNELTKATKEKNRLKGTEGFYVESVEEKVWSPDDVVAQLKRDFDSYLDGLKLELDVHRKEIESHEATIDKAIDSFVEMLTAMKGVYR